MQKSVSIRKSDINVRCADAMRCDAMRRFQGLFRCGVRFESRRGREEWGEAIDASERVGRFAEERGKEKRDVVLRRQIWLCSCGVVGLDNRHKGHKGG
jgi:hypothetical protein